jgi:hypothetical protein
LVSIVLLVDSQWSFLDCDEEFFNSEHFVGTCGDRYGAHDESFDLREPKLSFKWLCASQAHDVNAHHECTDTENVANSKKPDVVSKVLVLPESAHPPSTSHELGVVELDALETKQVHHGPDSSGRVGALPSVQVEVLLLVVVVVELHREIPVELERDRQVKE